MAQELCSAERYCSAPSAIVLGQGFAIMLQFWWWSAERYYYRCGFRFVLIVWWWSAERYVTTVWWWSAERYYYRCGLKVVVWSAVRYDVAAFRRFFGRGALGAIYKATSLERCQVVERRALYHRYQAPTQERYQDVGR